MKNFTKDIAIIILKIVIEMLIIDACLFVGRWVVRRVSTSIKSIKAKFIRQPDTEPEAAVA